jgi:uncharacterized protein (DUF2252 family)
LQCALRDYDSGGEKSRPEWDVKRLVASFVLAARANGLTDAPTKPSATTPR